MGKILKIVYLFALVCALMLLWDCSCPKETTQETIIQYKTDTIRVVLPARVDTVIAEPQELSDLGLIWTGNIIEKGDTIYKIRFIPKDTIFIFEKEKDSINVVHAYKDTTEINTTTTIDEPTFLEQWWWLIALIAVAVIFIFLKLK